MMFKELRAGDLFEFDDPQDHGEWAVQNPCAESINGDHGASGTADRIDKYVPSPKRTIMWYELVTRKEPDGS